MYYELYLDSLFLLNVVLNLYILELVNYTFLRTATRKRVLLGAAAGAVCELLPFFFTAPVFVKQSIAFVLAALIMSIITFKITSLSMYLRLMETLLLFSILFSGLLMFFIKIVPFAETYLLNVIGIMGVGALCFLLLTFFLEQKDKKNSVCKVILCGEKSKIKVNALLDTGNCLIEPISGKPVSILDKSVFDNLCIKEQAVGYRAIPYHSIGKPNGILLGYLIPEITVEINGVRKSCKNIYVGISNEPISGEGSYKMILNPDVIQHKVKTNQKLRLEELL